MPEDMILAPLTFVVICLILGALLKAILKKTPIPYTVGLFAVGLLVGGLSRKGILSSIPELNDAVMVAGKINPDLILFLFLPILIFEAAFAMDAHIFRKTLVNASLLSVLGLIGSMFLMGALMMGINFIPGQGDIWNWNYALMFGALISATDPVAVVSLLSEVGVSKKFSTLVDAESMLNDGTGIVLFMLFFSASKTGSVSGSPVTQFLIVVAGGIVIGYLVAHICIWFINRVRGDEWVQNSSIIVCAYVTFIVAQQFLDVSGVIALVIYGLIMGRQGREYMQPTVCKFVNEFWELASYIANTLIFIIVGVVIATQVHVRLSHILILVGVYAGACLARAVIVYLFFPLMRINGYGMSARESVILTWAGLRGATGLCLAMMVANSTIFPEPIRNQVLFYTAGIVTLTLTVNATSMRWLLTKLNIVKEVNAKKMLDYTVREKVRQNSIDYISILKQNEELQKTNWSVLYNFLPKQIDKPQGVIEETELLANLRIRILDNEKSLVQALCDNGVISRRAKKLLHDSIDDLYDSDGKASLNDRSDFFSFYKESWWFKIARRVSVTSFLKRLFRSRIMIWYDVARGLLITQMASEQLYKEFESSSIMSSDDKMKIAAIGLEIRLNIAWAQRKMTELSAFYPEEYSYAITEKSVRMMLAHERETLESLFHQGVLTEENLKVLLNQYNSRVAVLCAMRGKLWKE